MTREWKSIENIKGLRYYEHKTRMYKKHKDRNYVIYYKLNGKQKNETLGWESDGWAPEKAVAKLQELKLINIPEGPQNLAEKRELLQKKVEEEKQLVNI